jgi:hypothetical protein
MLFIAQFAVRLVVLVVAVHGTAGTCAPSL